MEPVTLAATGIGSMPGTSAAEAAAVVAGELPELPHLVELPARGAGADLVGRTAAVLAGVSRDFALETVPTGWRRAGQVTRDLRRAGGWLAEDLDRAEQLFGDSGGAFKTQLCGPWTWAALVEGGGGQPVLRDRAFVTDLATAWAEAAGHQLADLRRRLPGRRLLVQVDEPMLPAVLEGRISTASGLERLPAVSADDAAAVLRAAVGSLPAPVVLHCCDIFPFAVARAAGVSAVSWDLSPAPDPGRDPRLAPAVVDDVAATAEAGLGLLLGVVPSTGALSEAASWRQVDELWRRTGLPRARLADVGISPSCGLAGATPVHARAALALSQRLASRCRDG